MEEDVFRWLSFLRRAVVGCGVMDVRVVLGCAGFAFLFRFDGMAIDVADGFDIGFGVVLKEALGVIEEVEIELFIVDDSRNLVEFQ